MYICVICFGSSTMFMSFFSRLNSSVVISCGLSTLISRNRTRPKNQVTWSLRDNAEIVVSSLSNSLLASLSICATFSLVSAAEVCGGSNKGLVYLSSSARIKSTINPDLFLGRYPLLIPRSALSSRLKRS